MEIDHLPLPPPQHELLGPIPPPNLQTVGPLGELVIQGDVHLTFHQAEEQFLALFERFPSRYFRVGGMELALSPDLLEHKKWKVHSPNLKTLDKKIQILGEDLQLQNRRLEKAIQHRLAFQIIYDRLLTQKRRLLFENQIRSGGENQTELWSFHLYAPRLRLDALHPDPFPDWAELSSIFHGPLGDLILPGKVGMTFREAERQFLIEAQAGLRRFWAVNLEVPLVMIEHKKWKICSTNLAVFDRRLHSLAEEIRTQNHRIVEALEKRLSLRVIHHRLMTRRREILSSAEPLRAKREKRGRTD